MANSAPKSGRSLLSAFLNLPSARRAGDHTALVGNEWPLASPVRGLRLSPSPNEHPWTKLAGNELPENLSMVMPSPSCHLLARRRKAQLVLKANQQRATQYFVHLTDTPLYSDLAVKGEGLDDRQSEGLRATQIPSTR